MIIALRTLGAGLLVALFALFVFRVLVRRDYERHGRLTPLSSLLQLVVWAGFFGFPYLYSPADWALFRQSGARVGPVLKTLGFVALAIGFALAFITMIWIGLRRALGLQVSGLVETGPYRFSRNPQIVGGYSLVAGMVLLEPSWYALCWVVLYGFISHLMVMTEEEHLRATFGRPYQACGQRVGRYLSLPRGRGTG